MKVHPPFGKILRYFALICFAMSALIGIGAILSWTFDAWRIGTFGSDFIPMAPSTAWLFILLNFGLISYRIRPAMPATICIAFFAAFSAIAMSLMILVQFFFVFELPIETWLISNTTNVAGIPIGRMSPLTATLFLSAALALLFELPPLAHRRLLRQISSLLSLLVFLISASVFLSYLAGLPFFYDNRTIIPMAMLTAVAFALLSLGVMSTSGPDANPFGLFGFTPVGPFPDSSSLLSRGHVGTILFLAIAIATVGTLFLRHQITVFSKEVKKDLAIIAELKSAQIAAWYYERKIDAEVIFNNPMIQSQAGSILVDPTKDQSVQEFLVWMQGVQRLTNYRRVSLYDAQGVLRLSAPSGSAAPRKIGHQKDFLAALHARGCLTKDLHRDENYPKEIIFDIWIPLGIKPGTDKPAAGVLLLEIDPYQDLFPLIQGWPTRSQSAETLLVRREGDQVVFLNNLRYRSDAALNLRFTLDRNRQLPAGMAVMGQRGSVTGRDYRNVPVLAYVQGITGTPWFMIAKIDQDEIYAPLRAQAWRTWGIIFILIMASTLIINLRWRKRVEEQQARRAEELYQAQKMEAVGLLAGGMAHDFNNLLTAVIGYIALAKMKVVPSSEVYGFLDISEKSTEQARALGQKLVTLARGGHDSQRTTPLAPLITSSVNAVLDGTIINGEFDLPDEMPPALINAPQMQQVFSHLAANAVEAMSTGGTLRVSALTRSVSGKDGMPLPPGDYLHITFRDTGIGIPPEKLPKIFDPYFTTKEMGSQKGQGLGLALCHAIIRKHNGLITAESAPGEGVTFHIWLPVAVGEVP